MDTVVTDFSTLDLNKVYSYADYLKWQFDERVELIRGRIFPMSPAPSRKHQDICMSLTAAFLPALKHHGGCKLYAAPFDVRFPTGLVENDQEIIHVVQPDLCVVCDMEKLDDRGCLGAPDLIVEILSPGNTKREMQDKFKLYEAQGVTEYWIVFPPEELVQQFVLDDVGQYRLHQVFNTGDTITSYQFAEIEIDLDAMMDV